jgi:hypothetical protein
MSKALLVKYIRMVMEDVTRPAPNQLLSPEQADEDSGKEGCAEKEIDEFSGAGAIAGYTAPLGMDPDSPKVGRKRERSGKRR